MGPDEQAKLLRALESGEVRRVGGGPPTRHVLRCLALPDDPPSLWPARASPAAAERSPQDADIRRPRGRASRDGLAESN